MRARVLKIGVANFSYGYGFCYLRHKDYGSWGTATTIGVISCGSNDLIRVEWTCDFDSGSNFNDNMLNRIWVEAQGLTIQYLG